MYWCNDCTAAGRHHLSGSVLSEADACDIYSAGEAYDQAGDSEVYASDARSTLNTKVANTSPRSRRSPLQNSLSF